MHHQADSEDEGGLDLQKVAAIALRRRWWIMVPFFALGLLGLAAAEKWPLRYRSEARILVEQQQVSDQYVAPNIVASLQARLDSATQQILSRSSLGRIVEQFHLSRGEPVAEEINSAIAKLRRGITFEVAPAQGRQGELATCSIGYSSTSARMAQRVTQFLTALFIDENLRAEAQQSVNTTAFLESELEEAHRNLAVQDERLRAYKQLFPGQLPDQQQVNLQILSSLQSQLQGATAALERAQQQQIYLESMRSHYQALSNEFAARDGSTAQANGRLVPASASEIRLQTLRKELDDLMARYTPNHPDVIALQARIAELESRRRRLDPAKPQTESKSDGVSSSDPSTVAVLQSNQPGAMEVSSRLKAVAAEIASLRKDEEELRKKIAVAEARLEQAPERDQQLAERTRASESARVYYDGLLQKKLQSGMATKLERRQQQERFRVLDPASLPTQPEGKRKVMAMGWVLGLMVGAALAAFRERADATVHGEDDAVRWSSLQVLASIPVLRSVRERQRKRWSLRLEALAVVLLGLASITAALRCYMGGW